MLGRFFVEVGKKKKKSEQKQAQSTAATKGAAPMASPNDVDQALLNLLVMKQIKLGAEEGVARCVVRPYQLAEDTS